MNNISAFLLPWKFIKFVAVFFKLQPLKFLNEFSSLSILSALSTKEDKFLRDTVEVALVNRSYFIDIYDTGLGRKWLQALRENLKQKFILEKNFCFLGDVYVGSKWL